MPKIAGTLADLNRAPKVPLQAAPDKTFDAYRGHVNDAAGLLAETES